MEKIVKIEEVSLPKLNNMEYANLMSRTQGEVKKVTLEAIGVAKKDFETFGANIKKMEDLVAKSRINDITAAMDTTDEQRDDVHVYLLAEIGTKRNSPLATISEAAVSLYNATKQYIGGHNLPHQQQTQLITGLVFDLKKEENAPKVAALGLTEIVSTLEMYNNEYKKLTAERTSSNESSKIDSSKTVRAENDPIYDYIITKAFVASVATPSAATVEFVTEMNAIIAETQTRYKQRRAAAKAAEKKEKEKEAAKAAAEKNKMEQSSDSEQ